MPSPLRDFLHGLGQEAPDMIREFSRRGAGRGFRHFVGAVMDEAGFDRTSFRSGRKLSSDDLQLLLLALIAEKPSHGYDLIKLLGERSGGYYVPSPGMVYPALTYLEEAGYASVEPDGTKKLYRLSDAGQVHLDRNRETVQALLSQLGRIGRRMDDMHRAFAERDEDQNETEDSELSLARRELRRVLRERRNESLEESRRIAGILRGAAADIIRRQ